MASAVSLVVEVVAPRGSWSRGLEQYAQRYRYRLRSSHDSDALMGESAKHVQERRSHDRPARLRIVHGRRHRDARRDRPAGAVAVDGDHPSRQPGSAQRQRHEGRRASGVLCVDGLDHDVALLRATAGRRPGVGQTACVPGAARRQLPARRTRREVSDHAARVRRPAELSQPIQGSRSGRLLDGVGGNRCHCADLGSIRPPLRRHRVREHGHRSPVLAGRGRRTRRRRGLGGDPRFLGARTRRDRLDRRHEPPVTRPRRAQHRGRPVGDHVRRRRMAGHQRQVRQVARRTLRPPGW